jgi:large subunit ribosomal protein L17
MWSNMITSLIIHERIETTEPKAKELKRLADRTISWGMSVVDVATKDARSLKPVDRSRLVHAKRMAGRVVRSSEALSKLFHEVAPRLKEHKGGFTRLLKTRVRTGDAAPMAYVELVERAEEVAAPASEPEPEQKGKKAKAKKAEE